MNKKYKNEILGGLTTFLTMSYIVVVNPSILSTSGTGLSLSGVLTATVALAFLMTLLMGIYAKLPFAVAPGMGINAFFTYTLVIGQKIPWPTALGMVFWAGVIFLIASITSVRKRLAEAIPQHLRVSAAVGIGLFLTFVGLKNAGVVVADPVTCVKFAGITLGSALSICGLIVSVFFLRKKSPFAFVFGIAVVTAAALLTGHSKVPQKFFSKPDFDSVFFKLDVLSALKPALLPAIFSIFFTDLFDSISTFVGVSHATGLIDKTGNPKNLKQGLVVDSLATLFAGLFGTSSGTAYIESSAGIEMGGRSGLSAIVTALCFLPCFFIGPLVEAIPAVATAPVLILVGYLMFRSIRELSFEKIEDVLPSFLTIILIPLTFSITQGLVWGFLFHAVLYTMVGRRKEIGVWMWAICAFSVAMLCS